MRFALILLVACGGKNEAKEDGPRPPDTAIVDTALDDGPVPDAPVLPACANPVNGTTMSARRIVAANQIPGNGGTMLVTAPKGDPRLFTVGRRGQIRIVADELVLPTPFLDLTDSVISSGGEQGLLGLAFHPNYHVNRTFFVYYTRTEDGDATFPYRDVVARCKTSAADPNVAEPTCTEILVIRDRFTNHNGGMIEFGPDHFLYIGTGDGGSGGDPDGNGQALTDGALTTALLGKLLRIDVDHPAAGKEYGIPADNPFASAPEVYALGLRNPWRWSFDAATGDLWIGDVGQGPNRNPREEIDFVKAGELAGKNFGWSMYEGNNCFTEPCDPTGKHFPIEERLHVQPDNYLAIIGGGVYRGTCYPDIVGRYFYTDFNAGGLASATIDADGTYTKQDLVGTFPPAPTSIHADARGELYLTTQTGAIFHLEASP